MPTSSGKTEVAAALAQHVKPDRVLVICDRTALMSQTADRLSRRLKEPVGKVGGGYKALDRRVTCATIQSLWHHKRKFTSFFQEQMVVAVDEAHTVTTGTWFDVLKLIPAPVRLGLSATIKEAARRLVVEAYLGPIIFESGVDALIESGRAAEPRISVLSVGGLVDSSISDHEYAYTHGVVRNTARNGLIVDAVLKARHRKLPTLVLVVRIDHGHQLRQSLVAQSGLHVPFLYGQTPLDMIERAKGDLASGTIPAVIASTIFDFGQNIPEIRALILAGGMRSPLRTIQRVGRSLRAKTSGDNVTHVLDFFDHAHGMLASQSRERVATYRKKYGAARVRQIASLDEWLA
jgi:superfamily II DNA or RNA helicase